MEKNIRLHQATVNQLSKAANEPELFLNKRLKAFEKVDKLDPLKIERLNYSDWNLWNIPTVQTEDKQTLKVKNQIHSDHVDTGVVVLNFEQAMLEHPEMFKEIYEESGFMQQDNLFNVFTMAFLTDSLFIYIPENVRVEEPIELSFTQNNKIENSVNRQVLIYAAANSSVEIIEKYSSTEDEIEATANIHIDVLADSGAKIQYASLDQFGKKTTAFIRRVAKTKNDAVINWALGIMNEGKTVEDIRVDLEGNGSSSDVKTVAITHADQVQGINIQVTNIGRNTVGNIFQHGVALDESTLIFNGIGHILRDSKNSDAQQESRVLMLSDKARADANPILLIDEYEVQAGHAASISRVDQEQLYYLMSRGLEEKQAEKLIIHGFLGIVLSEISIPEVRQELVDIIERKLVQYGS